MKPVGKFKQAIKILAGLAGLGAAGLLYLYFQLFAEVKTNIGAAPNNLDATEAARKLGIFKNAKEVHRKGYIRLTEGEINSELFKFYASVDDQKKVTLPFLSKCRVILDQGDVVLLCWVRAPFLNSDKNVVWRRRFEVDPSNTENRLSLVSMHLGEIQVPVALWPKVDDWIGRVDNSLRQNFAWVLDLPRVEVHSSEDSPGEELKIFTYYPEQNTSGG